MMNARWIGGLVFICLAFVACKTKVTPQEETPLYSVNIEFHHQISGEDLNLETSYMSPLGHAYKVRVLKYFITNIQLKDVSGITYVIPQDSSYFLIDEHNKSSKIIGINVPEGEYNEITFLIGVDSLRNTMDISQRQGALDPSGIALGMYWGWNSGYIHLVFEGSSSDIPIELSGTQDFNFHVGGFGGYSSPTINNLKWVTLDLTEKGTLRVMNTEESSELHLVADLNLILRNKMTGEDFDFTMTPSLMFDRESATLASNYQHMFSHQSTVNK